MEDVHAKLTAKLHHFLANNVWRARKQQQAAGDTLEEDEAARGITRISYASKKKKKYIGLVPPSLFCSSPPWNHFHLSVPHQPCDPDALCNRVEGREVTTCTSKRCSSGLLCTKQK